MRFKIWFEELQPNPMQSQNQGNERDKKIRDIWKKTFDVLGVGGFTPEDAAQESLSKINFGRQSDSNNVFKGKRAVMKRLSNGQIFDQLKNAGDPELAKTVERAKQWLDNHDSQNGSNASTTVGELLKILFGEKYFNSFIDSDFPKDDAKAQVQPQPPKNQDQGTPNNNMDQETPQPQLPVELENPTNQPQVAGNMQPPPPQNPMPPMPPGANKGLF